MKHKSTYPLKFPFFLGFQIHHQLKGKLFCNCKFESEKVLKNTKKYTSALVNISSNNIVETTYFDYKTTSKICEYELDQKEPVLNQKIIQEALIISQRVLSLCKTIRINTTLLEFTFVRKKILDGSLFNGFQRTAIIGKNDDFIIRLEEDSCMKRKEGYDLSRQGVALVEITSRKHTIKNQEDLVEFLKLVEKTGNLIRENNVEKKSGSIRQDLNISIPGGVKVEIKGVSSLSRLRKIIEKELERQDKLLDGYEIKEHTRSISSIETGQTRFLRDYNGVTRYFSEPEIRPYSSYLPILEISSRNLESKVIQLFLNDNLQKEINNYGLFQFRELLVKYKISSILELTSGEISSLLQGHTLISYRKLLKLLSSLSLPTLQEARSYLVKNKLAFNKYALGYFYKEFSLKELNLKCNTKKRTTQTPPLLFRTLENMNPLLEEDKRNLTKEYYQVYFNYDKQ